MHVSFSSSSKEEVQQAVNFYNIRSVNLGKNFLNELSKSVDNIQKFPGIYRRFVGEYRRCVMSHFPYAVVYKFDSERIFIAAVMHMKREPEYWLK